MILCLDIGNTQVYGGVFNEGELVFRFRHNSKGHVSSDQFGLFLKTVLRENDIDPTSISGISLCTVVPHLLYTIRNACLKYFNTDPFILGPGEKTGLKINYRNPLEVGADRIANSISGVKKFPDRNLIIVDFGTATTFCAIKKDKTYLGGSIIAGLRLSMESLEAKTAKLPSVEIRKVDSVIGRSTVESLQSGLYYGHAFAVKGILEKITEEYFSDDAPIVIGTGGFAHLFDDEKIFHQIIPNLVLEGLRFALLNNR